MPLFGFSVFHNEVKDGKKRHRKQPIKVGDTLYLYWHLRRKDCHLLKNAKCIETFTQTWRMLKASEEIAKRDGFNSSIEMREWFNHTKYPPDDEEFFDVIRW